MRVHLDTGATIIAIGPFTNLALLAVERPGVLERASVVMMAGWFGPPAEGLPAWGAAQDWNVQCDTTAARLVIGHAGAVTMAPVYDGNVLRFADSGLGHAARVAVDVDAHAFDWRWLAAVEAADRWLLRSGGVAQRRP